tara:strand:- start:8 stop:319 length:312 start_codon:yes stop_codon:yes gene_type:complete
MELTEKCKEEFEKWWINFMDQEMSIHTFIQQHKSMQWGVYVDFFDSVGFNIVIEQLDYQSWYNYRITNLVLLQFKGTKLSCRPKTRLSAIDKANELHNEFLNK